MGRKPMNERVRAQALERLQRGESARSVARELGVSSTAVRSWARAGAPARAQAPAPAPAARAARAPMAVSRVHDAEPPELVEPRELDAETLAQASAAAALEDEPPPAGAAPAGAQGPASATTPPETVVDLFEGAVGLCIRLVVVGKGGEWTDELERACRFTPGNETACL